MKSNSLFANGRAAFDLLFAQRLFLLSAVLISGIILATLGNNRNELNRLNAQRASLNARVESLTGTLAAANTEIVKLQNDSRRLERDARERLLMGQPGEYLIPVRELQTSLSAVPADRRDP